MFFEKVKRQHIHNFMYHIYIISLQCLKCAYSIYRCNAMQFFLVDETMLLPFHKLPYNFREVIKKKLLLYCCTQQFHM